MAQYEDNLDQVLAAAADDEVAHHTSPRQLRSIAPAKMTVNLTSMIDVIFQLQIYFLLTAAFTVGEGVITANLPQGDANPTDTPPEAGIKIVLKSLGKYDCNIEIDGIPETPTDFKSLQDLLIENQFDPAAGRGNGTFKPEDPVTIKPSGDVRWQHVVDAFNAAVSARYKNVAFAQVTD